MGVSGDPIFLDFTHGTSDKPPEIRDRFAAAALTGLLSGVAPIEGPDWTAAELAGLAFGIAEAMMEEWSKRRA